MMSLLSIKINFFKTIKTLNIFQYILTHLIISNQIQYKEQDFFKFGIDLIVVILSAKKNCIDVP